MAQNLPQFQRSSLRVGLIAFLAGVVIAILSTTIHPSREEAFEYTNIIGLRGISMIIYFIWVGILVVLCGKNQCLRVFRRLEKDVIIISVGVLDLISLTSIIFA